MNFFRAIRELAAKFSRRARPAKGKTSKPNLTVKLRFEILEDRDVPSATPWFVQYAGLANVEGDVVNTLNMEMYIGPAATITAANLPNGLAVDSGTGAISGTVDNSDAEQNGGNYSVTLTATDALGESDSVTFPWTITNRPPELAPIADQTNAEGDVVSLQASASDMDGNPIAFSAASLPQGLAVDLRTGLISGTIDFSAAEQNGGNYSVSVTATDSVTGLSDTKTFAWTVTNTNRPPSISPIPDQSNLEGDIVMLQAGATDPDNDVLNFSAGNLPPGLSIDSTTGAITGTILPGAATGGDNGDDDYTTTVTVSDGTYTATATFAWDVAPRIALPVIDDQTNVEGDTVALSVSASTPDSGRILAYSAANLPSGLSINPTTGAIIGTILPGEATDGEFNDGLYLTTISATDGTYTATTTFSWDVAPVGSEFVSLAPAPKTAIDGRDLVKPLTAAIASAKADLTNAERAAVMAKNAGNNDDFYSASNRATEISTTIQELQDLQKKIAAIDKPNDLANFIKDLRADTQARLNAIKKAKSDADEFIKNLANPTIDDQIAARANENALSGRNNAVNRLLQMFDNLQPKQPS